MKIEWKEDITKKVTFYDSATKNKVSNSVWRIKARAGSVKIDESIPVFMGRTTELINFRFSILHSLANGIGIDPDQNISIEDAENVESCVACIRRILVSSKIKR